MKLSFNPKSEPLPPPINVILASQSIGRRTLLEKLGLRFRVIVTHLDEEAVTDSNPLKMLVRRAEAKAQEIVNNQRVYNLSETGKNLVIAADSMAILGKRAFGKARDREETKTILKALMGKTHVFTTALHLVLLEEGLVKKSWQKVAKTRVTLRKLNPLELESYLSRFDLTRFAGGYAFGEAPWDIVTKIDGSYTNVIGLPFEILLPVLRQLKIIA